MKNEIVKGVALNIAFSIWIVYTDISGEGKELRTSPSVNLSPHILSIHEFFRGFDQLGSPFITYVRWCKICSGKVSF